MFLHEINLSIINSLSYYGINYIISFLLIILFIIIVFKIGLKTLKRMVKHDKMYLRILLIMVTIDALISTGLFFYEIFFNKSVLGGLIVILITITILLNSGGWLCIAYNMIYSARKNPFLGMKMYLPMLILLLAVYVSHIHLYYSVGGIISIYVLLFWEWRALVTISLSFIRSIYYFIKSVSSSMDILENNADNIEKDLKGMFFKD